MLDTLTSILLGTYQQDECCERMNGTTTTVTTDTTAAADCRLDRSNKMDDNSKTATTTTTTNFDCCAQREEASTCKEIVRSDVSQFKITVIDYLPSENFTFIRCENDEHTKLGDEDQPPPPGGRRLLILFAWLFAKQRHLDKYRALYMAEGFDVLTVVVHVRDFLLPPTGSQRIAAQIIRFLRRHQHEYSDYIFQAFSVGAYQAGEVYVMLHKDRNKELLAETKKRLKGLIYDSALDLEEAPIGLSKATTDNTLLQWGIATLMYVHLRLSYHICTRHYINSSEAVKANIMEAPTLVFMSKDDVVINYQKQIKVIEKWREQRKSGDDTTGYKCWDQSPHVSHFFKHRDEYIELVKTFLKKVL